MKHHSIHTDSVRSGLVLHIWFGQNVGAKAISKLKISSAMIKKEVVTSLPGALFAAAVFCDEEKIALALRMYVFEIVWLELLDRSKIKF